MTHRRHRLRLATESRLPRLLLLVVPAGVSGVGGFFDCRVHVAADPGEVVVGKLLQFHPDVLGLRHRHQLVRRHETVARLGELLDPGDRVAAAILDLADQILRPALHLGELLLAGVAAQDVDLVVELGTEEARLADLHQDFQRIRDALLVEGVVDRAQVLDKIVDLSRLIHTTSTSHTR